jgi:hypothetical protein
MKGYRDMPIEEMVRIEDKDDLIHNIEQEVRERMELMRQWMERDADKRRRNISASLYPRAYAYLSTNAITLPWDNRLYVQNLDGGYSLRSSGGPYE